MYLRNRERSSACRASPHRIGKAENRKGGIAVRESPQLARADSGERRSGIVRSLAASDSASRPANAAGAKTSREAAGQTARSARVGATVKQFAQRSSRDGSGPPGMTRTLAWASNSPIGSVGPGGLRRSTSRRRLAHEHDATADDQRVKKRRRGSPRIRPAAASQYRPVVSG
jgi:hypothetical protein